MLSQMREERESFQKNNDVYRSEKTKKEEEKEFLGRQVVEMALLCNSQRSGSGGSSIYKVGRTVGMGESKVEVRERRYISVWSSKRWI